MGYNSLYSQVVYGLACLYSVPLIISDIGHRADIYLYGGYSKEVSSDKNSSSEKGIVHSDMWSLDPLTWEWNKLSRKAGCLLGLVPASQCVSIKEGCAVWGCGGCRRGR
ncbi:hypothetical protein OROMI_019595 [Orobanche minor]